MCGGGAYSQTPQFIVRTQMGQLWLSDWRNNALMSTLKSFAATKLLKSALLRPGAPGGHYRPQQLSAALTRPLSGSPLVVVTAGRVWKLSQFVFVTTPWCHRWWELWLDVWNSLLIGPLVHSWKHDELFDFNEEFICRRFIPPDNSPGTSNRGNRPVSRTE